jgi:hypothetical protein
MAELAVRGVAQVLITDDAGAGALDANPDGIPDVQAGYDIMPAGTDSPEALAERAVTALLGRLRS